MLTRSIVYRFTTTLVSLQSTWLTPCEQVCCEALSSAACVCLFVGEIKLYCVRLLHEKCYRHAWGCGNQLTVRVYACRCVDHKKLIILSSSCSFVELHCTEFSPRIIQGMMERRGLWPHQSFWPLSFPTSKRVRAEGPHTFSILGRTLLYHTECVQLRIWIWISLHVTYTGQISHLLLCYLCWLLAPRLMSSQFFFIISCF